LLRFCAHASRVAQAAKHLGWPQFAIEELQTWQATNLAMPRLLELVLMDRDYEQSCF